MKLILPRLFLAAFLLLAAQVSATAAELKVAGCNMRRVFDGYWKTKQADARLKEMGVTMDKEHKTYIDDYTKAQDEYKKLLESANDPAAAAEEREKRKKAAEAKLRDISSIEQSIRQFERASTTKLDEQKTSIRNAIVAEIRDVINGKAKAAGYTLVIDTSSENINQTSVFIYVDPALDITDAVLAQMNSTAPAGALGNGTEPKTEKK